MAAFLGKTVVAIGGKMFTCGIQDVILIKWY